MSKDQKKKQTWTEANPEKNRARVAAWAKANPEKVRARVAKWQAAHPDRVEVYNKISNDRLRTKTRAAPEANRARVAAWAKANPEKRIARAAKRRAIQLNAPGEGVTGKQWERLLKTSNGVCFYCGRVTDSLTMDHIVPLSRGGSHDIDNIVPACKSCNSSKGAKLLSEWSGQ